MSSPKRDSHVYIHTALYVVSFLIFGALFVRLELKIAHYEERLNEFEETKMSCCDKGKTFCRHL